MLFLRLYQAFVLLFPLMINWNSVASSKKLWKQQAANLCPNSKWLEYEGMCFLKVSAPTTFVDARNVCRNKGYGSYLAKIRSMDDLNTINSRFAFGDNSYWIGLVSGSRTWLDGSPATFLNFAPGEPSNNTNEDCISLRSDLGFYDELCNQRYWSICSVSASVDLCNTENVTCHENAQCYSTFSAFMCLCNDGFVGDGMENCTQSAGCPNDEWKEHKGMCYILNSNETNFEDARNECRAKFNGSTLATIRYVGDQKFLVNSMPFTGSRWIGLKKTNTWRDEQRWDDGSIVAYRNFYANQPSDKENTPEDCTLFDEDGGWNDFVCNAIEGSFCSINAKKAISKETTTVEKKTFESTAVSTTTTVATTTTTVATTTTTTDENTTDENTTDENTTDENTTDENTTDKNTTNENTIATSNGGSGAIIAVVLGILLIGGCVGYKKLRIQQSKARGDLSKHEDISYQDIYSVSSGED